MFRIRVKQASALWDNAIKRAINAGKYKPDKYRGKMSKVVEYEVLRHYHQVCGVWAARAFLKQNPEGLSGVHDVYGHDYRTPFGNILVVTALDHDHDIVLPEYAFQYFDYLVLLRLDGDWRNCRDTGTYVSAGAIDADTFVYRLSYEMRDETTYRIPQKILGDFDEWYEQTYKQWNPTAKTA